MREKQWTESHGPRASFWLFLCLLIPSICGQFTQDSTEDIPHFEVEEWARKIGNFISGLSEVASRYKEIEENLMKENARITENDGLKLIKQMSTDVTNMMKYKVQAVARIMNVAEEVSQDPSQGLDEWEGYYNAKVVNQNEEFYKRLEKRYKGRLAEYYGVKYEKFFHMDLLSNIHFDGIPVNLTMSTVHVPTNVFEGGDSVRDSIRWSTALDKTFISNYNHDPTLSWQYFGSATGFLRQFPGAAWEMDLEDPDLFDSRLRSWYIQAASSPKDMVILLDVSGSMTGLRREIANHVVVNLLETLNDNDFVQIFTFSEDTAELVPCFNDTLVQANLENIGEFKEKLREIKTQDIANFTKALSRAFELLAKHDKTGRGSECNQAIMLVTDGSPYTYDHVFKKFNWPQLQVRVFTYLIGREVSDAAPLSWMACANKGYFVRVTTPSEVREQVLKYIPVMARPMVMYQKDHPHIWTGVYADIAGRRGSPKGRESYRLVTSVSIPVFDRNRTKVRIADLLGVAGTDVPIREIQKLVPPYQLGVNAYSFMVNKNGHVLYHPDLRPIHEDSNSEALRRSKDKRQWFQDILKPNYNSVDLSEVELVDGVDEPRQNESDLAQLRRNMIDQNSIEMNLRVKTHLDDLKRVIVRNQSYFTAEIRDTPFSLGIAMPDKYGKYKVEGQIELSLASKNRGFNATRFFVHGNWRVHPEWVYCEYKYDQGEDRTPEELLLHFLTRAQRPGWKWLSTRTKPPPDVNKPGTHQNAYDERDHYCDKELIQSLLFDAKVTNVFNGSMEVSKQKQGEYAKYGLTTAFVATRSGLTRWHDYEPSPKILPDDPHFMELQDRAIEEIWYKRAVDYYQEDPTAFVYSVPFDAAMLDNNTVLVTASRALYVQNGRFRHAPAAVVGVTYKLNHFVEYFKRTTYECRGSHYGCDKKRTCESLALDCYLLDDNGFVIASESADDVGKFFGSIEGTIMESLVQSEVYNRIKIFDYQAVCLELLGTGSLASILTTPIELLKWSAGWMATSVMWFLVKTNLYILWDADAAWAYTHTESVPQYVDNLDQPHYEEGGEDDIPPDHTKVSDFPDYESMVDEAAKQLALEYADELNRTVPEYDEGIEDTDHDDDDDDDYDIDFQDVTQTEQEEESEFPNLQLAFINKTKPRPCDKDVNLYKLNNSKLRDSETKSYKPVKGKLSNCHSNGCGRPFSVQKVIHTNLVLIVVHNSCPCESRTVTIEPQEIDYSESVKCSNLLQSRYRVRPSFCSNYHPDEVNIKQCGRGATLSPSMGAAVVSSCLLLFFTKILHFT